MSRILLDIGNFYKREQNRYELLFQYYPPQDNIFYNKKTVSFMINLLLFLIYKILTKICIKCLYNVCLEKSSHCYYKKDGLHNIDITRQPKRVDWNVYVSAMTTSLY